VETSADRQSVISTSSGRRSVNLDIAGDDFMLQGNFSDWESGLAFGPDLDRVQVKLAIDTTSTLPEDAGRESLFTFHSRKVESRGEGRYRVVGTFTGSRGAKAMELAIESPLGHTALIVLTFAAKKQDFGDGWHDLIANVGPFSEHGTSEGESPVRSAHAWLIPPPLGAA
jgi:polyisoprenoid-binding protein YceI